MILLTRKRQTECKNCPIGKRHLIDELSQQLLARGIVADDEALAKALHSLKRRAKLEAVTMCLQVPHDADSVGLGRREQEVLACLRAELEDKEISGALGISVATVKTYVRRLLAKFGARSRREFVLNTPGGAR